MTSSEIINELNRTRSLCEQVDSLYQSANAMGRMLSLSETIEADQLSRALVKQIRKLPRKLSLEKSSPRVRLEGGETFDLVRTTLRRIAFPSERSESRCSPGARQMQAYNV